MIDSTAHCPVEKSLGGPRSLPMHRRLPKAIGGGGTGGGNRAVRGAPCSYGLP